MLSDQELSCLICKQKVDKKSKGSLFLLKIFKSLQIQKKKHQRLISLPSEIYFRQLVQYMIQQKKENTYHSQNCSHNIIKQVLIKKLQVSIDQLYCLCQRIFEKLSRRRFQLELVQKITKNIHQRVLDMEINVKEYQGLPLSRNKSKIVKKIDDKPQSPTTTTIHTTNFNIQIENNSQLIDKKTVKTLPSFTINQQIPIQQMKHVKTSFMELQNNQWMFPFTYGMFEGTNGYCFFNGVGGGWMG